MIGLLALQGDVIEHRQNLERAGAAVRLVKTPRDLEGLRGLVLPGGESTALRLLIAASELVEPIAGLIERGLPVWGTCAGVVLLAAGGVWPVVTAEVERNAYGPQLYSCVTRSATSLGEMDLVFIRAPRLLPHGEAGIEVLARAGGDVVALRQNRILLTTFHPELVRDDCFAPYFCEMAAQSS